MDVSIESAFKNFLEIDFKKIQKYKKAVLAKKETEPLHQMRVSLRRMRSVLFTFQSVIPKKITKKIDIKIATVASYCNRARDIDVYMETYLKKETLSSTESLLYKIVVHYREKEYKKIQKYLKSHKYKKLIRELRRWIQTKKWRKKLKKKELSALEKNIIPFAENFLKSYTNEIILYGSATGSVLEDEQAHKLRIKLKKLRYATDLFSAYLQKKDTLTNTLKELQDILGKLHDIYVTKELHKVFLQSQKNKKLFTFIKQLEAENTKRKKKLKEAFFLKWKEFRKIAQQVD
ncbi:CHAD domain-containing protein [Sulfurimonas sp. NWX367]|uniref:CHAD domain-containing protein n=1 Tax=Sulfurimonas sp. NWX367 TaxID=2925413 RepID=UPI0032047979